MIKKKISEFVILGRIIGTYSGWDLGDTFVMQVYDFKPLEGLDLPETECLSFDLGTGLAIFYTEKIMEGEIQKDTIISNNDGFELIEHSFDFAPRIVHLPRE